MNSYIVAIRKKNEDNQMYSLLLEKKELADLLLNLNEEEYELGEIISTYSERKDSIIPFCKVDKNLETGGNEGEKK